MNEAAKGGQGGGTYFPLTAVQRWDSATMQIENGVYLGQIAALTLAASAHGPLCCPTWGNAREEAAAEVISSTGRGALGSAGSSLAGWATCSAALQQHGHSWP